MKNREREDAEVELAEGTSVIIDLDAQPPEDFSGDEIQYPVWLIFMVDHNGNEVIVDKSP